MIEIIGYILAFISMILTFVSIVKFIFWIVKVFKTVYIYFIIQKHKFSFYSVIYLIRKLVPFLKNDVSKLTESDKEYLYWLFTIHKEENKLFCIRIYNLRRLEIQNIFDNKWIKIHKIIKYGEKHNDYLCSFNMFKCYEINEFKNVTGKINTIYNGPMGIPSGKAITYLGSR